MVAVLLCSNLIGPAKVCAVTLPVVGLVSFGAGNLFFPISYIFGDILTEVYGYARARRAIWAGFVAMIFASAMAWVVLNIPAADTPYNRELQPALDIVFGSTGRIVAASILAYWVGDFVNSYVLARMKVWTQGRWLWTRTIGSTIFGQGVDSLLFVPSWSLGFGYVFLDGNAIVGGRFVFDLTSQTFEDDDEFGDTEDYRQTIVSGQLVPYFRYLFRPGTKIRPFLEGRFGFGGSATASESDSGANSANSSTIYPIVGAGGGAHFFIVDAFSVDAGLTFDYAAPHVKSRVESGDVVVETDYEKTGDFINIAAQAGFSVWF